MSTTATATLHTTAGDIRLNLFGDQAPKTVRNFTELALGSREWTHPATREKTSEPLYDGTIFHRVIPNFMIQGGDPLGQGYGGPGYQFGDEFHPELVFDCPEESHLSSADSVEFTKRLVPHLKTALAR